MKNIQLIAPASHVPNLQKTDLLTLEKQLNDLNIQLNYTKQLFKKKLFLAGSDEIRLSEFENAFKNKNVNFVLALRGGEGCMRLLNKIDYNLIKKNAKPFLGFSDTTALQNALWHKSKVQSFTGFIGRYGFKKIPPTL